MDHAQHSSIVNFIWSIADDVLRDVYVRGKYRDVILPMTVIRRVDGVLEETKDSVLKMKKQLDDSGIRNQDAALCQASGQSFFNTSPFTLRDLKARAKQQQLKADFEACLDEFSPCYANFLKQNYRLRKIVRITITNPIVCIIFDPLGREMLPEIRKMKKKRMR